MAYFVDTNVFLRFFIKESIQTFQQVKRVILAIKNGRLEAFTSHLAIAELEWTMKGYYGIPKNQRLEILNSILQLKNLSLVDNFDLPIALDFYRNYPVKFIDCLLASNRDLSSGKASMISYDKDFDKLKVKRVVPKDL